MTGYDFHPKAVNDLDEIWGFIAADNLDAADRMIGEILAFPDRGINARTSRPVVVQFEPDGPRKFRRRSITSRQLGQVGASPGGAISFAGT
jgi:plasmid stabilization system protein ParE